MSEQGDPGPDLQHGIPASQLADGAMMAGHVGEDAVLLARRGDEFFAIDAHCSHYHGPLAEGLMVGDCVRCPWHHAAFDLRTGSAVGAPAMRSLRTWTVIRDGGTVRVSPVAAPAVEQRAADVGHVVIVGAGAAGSFAASELRRTGYEGPVTLISAESSLPYDKPNLSKDYLAGKAPQEWIPLRERSEYDDAKVALRLETRVEAVDTASNELVLGGGERLAYDRLILATGARARHLDLPTASDACVLTLRSWTDADALREAASQAKAAVVIGASFIGLETAGSLRQLGLDVTVVGVEERPLERVFGAETGDFIKRLHERNGVRFRLGRKPVEARRAGVLLDDGTSEQGDLVVVAVGVEPELELARSAGLTIDRGVVVDEHLQTSAPNVYAAGDIARYPWSGRPIRVEHWQVAGRQGQAAARNAIGMRETFNAVPFFWSQHYDLVFAYVGHAERIDEIQQFGSLDETNYAAIFREGGRIAAVVTLFRDDVSLAVEEAMERGAGNEEIEGIVQRAFA